MVIQGRIFKVKNQKQRKYLEDNQRKMTLITGEEQIGQLQISHQKLCGARRQWDEIVKVQKEKRLSTKDSISRKTLLKEI